MSTILNNLMTQRAQCMEMLAKKVPGDKEYANVLSDLQTIDRIISETEKRATQDYYAEERFKVEQTKADREAKSAFRREHEDDIRFKEEREREKLKLDELNLKIKRDTERWNIDQSEKTFGLERDKKRLEMELREREQKVNIDNERFDFERQDKEDKSERDKERWEFELERDKKRLEMELREREQKLRIEAEKHESDMRKNARREKEDTRLLPRLTDISGDTLCKLAAQMIGLGAMMWWESEHAQHFRNSWNERRNIRG